MRRKRFIFKYISLEYTIALPVEDSGKSDDTFVVTVIEII